MNKGNWKLNNALSIIGAASRSVNIFAAIVALLLLAGSCAASGASQQEKGVEYLENVIRRFDAIKDYVVDVRIHMDLTAVQAPDMEATLYYKAPDKVKIDSKGLFFMPKDVGVINPRKFNPDDFIVEVLDTAAYQGDPAVRLSLIPKKDPASGHSIILTIDRKSWLIVRIEAAPYPGRQANADITYATFDGFQVPVKVEVNLDVPASDNQSNAFSHERKRATELKGKVEVYYSGYKINTGLSDDIFKKRNDD